jgi:hypothetical protein
MVKAKWRENTMMIRLFNMVIDRYIYSMQQPVNIAAFLYFILKFLAISMYIWMISHLQNMSTYLLFTLLKILFFSLMQ